MKREKENDGVSLKNEMQKALYEEYKKLTDEEREAIIIRKLISSDSPIGTFWRQNVLRVTEKKARYKSKNKS